MTFAEVFASLKSGQRLTRQAWNIPASRVRYIKLPQTPEEINTGFIIIFNDGYSAYDWLVSHNDLLADDWELIPS